MTTYGSSQPDRVFRFGPFELSEREGELGKSGVRIKLQEQPFRVLVELVAKAGRLVSREDLHQKLWPSDTFVDFDVGLNSAIRKLRRALNDDADHPHYIETLAKPGVPLSCACQRDRCKRRGATLAVNIRRGNRFGYFFVDEQRVR